MVEPETELKLEPELETGLELDLEPELVTELKMEPELVAELEPAPAIEPAPAPEIDFTVDLSSDLEQDELAFPSTLPAPQTLLAPPEEQYEDLSPEEEPAAADPGRGVFDTETLAAIYTNQGFYGRAAEIYQRLITQRPADTTLRGKLEAVLAREREESGIEEPAAAVAAALAQVPPPRPLAPPPGAPADAKRTGPDQTISRLNTLLEAFKEGRPR